MSNEIVYKDSLLEISNDKIIFQNYYFPSLKPKEVLIGSIEKVQVKEPSMRTGKFRYHGTGDFRTWYPLDAKRSKRDKIFLLFLNTQKVRIGFTSENTEAVVNYFKEKGLLI